jgi:hypothetical protein
MSTPAIFVALCVPYLFMAVKSFMLQAPDASLSSMFFGKAGCKEKGAVL